MMYAASCIVKAARCDFAAYHVVGLEIFVAEAFAGILFDTLYDGHAADGAVVRDVVVHTAVLLRTVDAAIVHESAFENINEITILVVEYQLAPGYFVHLAAEGEVVVPSQ